MSLTLVALEPTPKDVKTVAFQCSHSCVIACKSPQFPASWIVDRGSCRFAYLSNRMTQTLADPEGPPAPKIFFFFSKSCSFQTILRGETLFWANWPKSWIRLWNTWRIPNHTGERSNLPLLSVVLSVPKTGKNQRQSLMSVEHEISLVQMWSSCGCRILKEFYTGNRALLPLTSAVFFPGNQPQVSVVWMFVCWQAHSWSLRYSCSVRVSRIPAKIACTKCHGRVFLRLRGHLSGVCVCVCVCVCDFCIKNVCVYVTATRSDRGPSNMCVHRIFARIFHSR